MPNFTKSWMSDSFDAIHILANECEMNILGTDDDFIKITAGPGGENLENYLQEPAERWLKINICDRWLAIDHITLSLPKKKAWVIHYSAGRGNVNVKEIQARLQIMLGKGDIFIDTCRGKFSVRSGDGKVDISHFEEMEMPEKPVLPDYEGPIPPFPMGPGKNCAGAPWDRLIGSAEEWANWGIEMGNRAVAWSDKINRFFNQMGNRLQDPGISAQLGKGEFRAIDLNLMNCSVWLSKGNVQMDQSIIANLELNSDHGDLRLRSIFPKGNWRIRTSHGNINLSLPNNAAARLDVATRQGNIRSEIPLVRVNRPGPETSHGGRMVGTIGTTGGVMPELYLVTVHGDIKIDSISAERETNTMFWKKSTNSTSGETSKTGSGPSAADQTRQSKPDVIPLGAAMETGGQASNTNEQNDPALEILQSLSNGAISIEEADLLLRNLAG